MIYKHYSQVLWDRVRWPNFSPSEKNLHCPCCGEFYLDEKYFDCLQYARSLINKPLQINSGHRCLIHNARVGGKPLSRHKKIAFDVSLAQHNIKDLLSVLKLSGFTGFGYYSTFIHVDLGRPRFWITKGGALKWNGLIPL